MKVIIAEKPSVAREIASVLSVTSKQDGYIEGNGYRVTWAFGHLVELCPPDHYGWKEWKAVTLPMVPKAFSLQPSHKYNPATKESKPDPGVLKQLNVIEKLFKSSSEIIVATDAGREGELIFRYIYNYLGCKVPFSRLWISSLTHQAIQEGFKSLKPGSDYDNLYHSARSRSEADWLVGMNATRALSIAAGKNLFSIGRVQTPTLVMICKRYQEHVNFKPEVYYVLRIELEKQQQRFFAWSIESFKEKGEAEKRLKNVLSANFAQVTEVTTKEKTEAAPLLYDLTSLQQDANKKFSLSADNTLKAAQSLYEGKYITYPRTGSRYIPQDVFDGIPELIKKAEKHEKYGNSAASLQGKALNKRSVNDAKVTDHHALLITGNLPGELSKDERIVYDLIIARMLEAFNENCVKDVTVVKLLAGGEPFKANGSVIKQAGWRSVKGEMKEEEGEEKEKEDIEENENAALPPLVKDEKVPRIGAESKQKVTKPKPLLNEASLLKMMETCGKEIDNETLREALKESGLGTPATRAAVIETLLTRGYIERQKKNLLPTPKGLMVFEIVKDKAVASAELTGIWEGKLSEVSKGKKSATGFMEEIISYTKEITRDLLGASGSFEGADLRTSNKEQIICPKCGKGHLIAGEKNFYCSEYKKGCDFKIWKEIAGKKISESSVKSLVTKKETPVMNGFESKEGKGFSASLVLKEDFTVGFKFPPAVRPVKKAG